MAHPLFLERVFPMLLRLRTVVLLLALGAGTALVFQSVLSSNVMRPDAAFAQASDTTAPPTELQPHEQHTVALFETCLLYTSPSPRDRTRSRMPSSA